MKELCPNCFIVTTGDVCRICGYNSRKNENNLMRLPLFTILNCRYIIGKILGMGGFGITYISKDLEGNNICAIKEYMPAAFTAGRNGNMVMIQPEKIEVYSKGLNRFILESKTLLKLTENDSVVKIYDCFIENNTAYIVMEYLDGINMNELRKTEEVVKLQEEAYCMLCSLSSAMITIHQLGILHRDISPDNIIITKDKRIKLIDFGSSKLYLVGESDKSASIFLKHGFSPIEQYSSVEKQGPWTDIYALAATYYFLASGFLVPDAPSRATGTVMKTLYELDIGISQNISVSISKALALRAADRYSNMKIFHDAVISPGYYQQTKKESSVTLNPGKISLCITTGQNAGNRWTVNANTDIKIGRMPDDCNIVVTDTGVSRHHCTVRYDEMKRCFCLQDYSSNGTYLADGKRLEKEKIYYLFNNDVFYLSSRSCTFKLEAK